MRVSPFPWSLAMQFLSHLGQEMEIQWRDRGLLACCSLQHWLPPTCFRSVPVQPLCTWWGLPHQRGHIHLQLSSPFLWKQVSEWWVDLHWIQSSLHVEQEAVSPPILGGKEGFSNPVKRLTITHIILCIIDSSAWSQAASHWVLTLTC